MFQKTKLCTSLLLAFSGGMILASGSASAQERVEITGSRIKTVQTEGTSPVVVLGKEAIQLEGVRNAEQLLNNLPQVFADQGGSVSNGATGTATVNLRNLGSNRTLVLVNGRRLPGGSPRDISTDLNQIPVSLIKRVEILTGGASAIYGSDAVAGVVNFILDDKFEGVQIDLNHEFYNHQQHASQGIKDANAARQFALPGDKGADGKVTDFNLTLGGNFADGKGNAVLFFAHKTEDALREDQRDFSNCALLAVGGQWTCGGSSTAYPGRFIDLAEDGGDWNLGPDGAPRPWVGSRDQYNYAPSNYFQRPSDRYSVQALAHYDLADYARVYGEFSFHDDHTVAQIAPSGIFLGGFVTTVDYDNPLLSDAWKAALNLTASGDTADLFIGRRNVEGGGRQDDIRHSSYRGVIGVKGDINDAWSYDVSALVGKVLYQETYKNDFSNTRLLRALDVVDDGAGNAVCRSALDGTDPNCVPYNIWSIGGVTPQALAYLQTPGFQKGFTSTEVISASVNGDLTGYGVKTPWAKSGLGVALGVEHRTEEMDLSTDTAFTTGDLAGQGGPTIGVGGAFDVTDVFTEMRMPLIEKAPFAELLALNASYRYSDYSTGKKTSTWGVGVEWAPMNEFKVRASAQRASRAANIIELFSQAALGLYDNETGDPCAGDFDAGTSTPPPTATAEQCARTGVSAAQYGHIRGNPAGQYNAIFGGNANLSPETSKSWTVGFVVNPIRDMNLTLDWFHIRVDDIIGNIPATSILNQCLETGDSFYCNLVHRSSLTGDLWTGTPPDGGFIVATNSNLSFKETEGFDVGADYQLRLEGMGRIDFTFKGTLLSKFEAEDAPGFGSYDCAGYYGGTCGTPAPKWRHSLRTTWRSPWNLDLSLNWRYIDSVKNEGMSSNPLLNGEVDPLVAKLKSISYFDVGASYKATKNITLSAAINNILDTDPPIRNNGAGFTNGNTYPVVYDALGRRVSLTLNAKF
ncbi:TonB-dependent receptor domain-containing protein [Ideonella sp.]|uniref:TonB-dependent receptor domain-containing protein n=1 Tax=Ideonella sp. TaxID=1929293 RepID=UPI002B4A979D|nr:TonB-dependent receptor [Ideonella sp.]HJV70197.1 TonB-dependent receptor [Ideonella sp.]